MWNITILFLAIDSYSLTPVEQVDYTMIRETAACFSNIKTFQFKSCKDCSLFETFWKVLPNLETLILDTVMSIDCGRLQKNENLQELSVVKYDYAKILNILTLTPNLKILSITGPDNQLPNVQLFINHFMRYGEPLLFREKNIRTLKRRAT